MKGTGKRRLSLRRETLRRLAAGDLGRVAGGKVGVRCTYEQTGCAYNETKECPTYYCSIE